MRGLNHEVWEKTREKLRGHFAYYRVTDNSPGIARFRIEVKQILFNWLSRQGGTRRMNWNRSTLMERRFPFSKPRITVNLRPIW